MLTIKQACSHDGVPFRRHSQLNTCNLNAAKYCKPWEYLVSTVSCKQSNSGTQRPGLCIGTIPFELDVELHKPLNLVWDFCCTNKQNIADFENL